MPAPIIGPWLWGNGGAAPVAALRNDKIRSPGYISHGAVITGWLLGFMEVWRRWHG